MVGADVVVVDQFGAVVMSVIAPPELPSQEQSDDLEALIKEARARQRRRRIRAAFAAGVAAAIGYGIYAMVAARGPNSTQTATSRSGRASAHRCPPGDLGTVAFLRAGALNVLDLNGCRTRVLVRSHATGPVQFSFDGRYVAFHRGFVPVRGGNVVRNAGAGTWSPTSNVLVAGTKHGGLVLMQPGRPTRRLLPDGWGVLTFIFSPSGTTLAVSTLQLHGTVRAVIEVSTRRSG